MLWPWKLVRVHQGHWKCIGNVTIWWSAICIRHTIDVL